MYPAFSNSALPVLYIDDSENDRLLIQLAIQRQTNLFTLHTADSAGSARPFFDSEDKAHPCPALILLDYDLGDHTGADFLTWLRLARQFTTLPVVMYSGSDGTRNVSQCYAAGANHFIRKPTTFEGIEAIIRALHVAMSFNPPRFGVLANLAEYEPNPTAQHPSPSPRQPASLI